MKVWTTLSESDIYDIADEVGVAIAIQQSSTEGWGDNPEIRRVEIPLVGRAFSFGLRPRKSLGRRDGDYKYQRTSAGPFNVERRVFAVCWHGHRDFMAALYERDPHARIKSTVADYRGVESFEDNFEATGYRNVGAPIMPMQMREVCNCWKGEW